MSWHIKVGEVAPAPKEEVPAWVYALPLAGVLVAAVVMSGKIRR